MDLSNKNPLLDLTTLVTRRSEGWYWKDGTPEPRLFDLAASFFVPRFREIVRDERKYIEIPEGWELTHAWDGTKEVHDFVREVVESYGVEGEVLAGPCSEDESPQIPAPGDQVLVPGWIIPTDLYEAVMCEPMGAGWRNEDMADLLALAQEKLRLS